MGVIEGTGSSDEMSSHICSELAMDVLEHLADVIAKSTVTATNDRGETLSSGPKLAKLKDALLAEVLATAGVLLVSASAEMMDLPDKEISPCPDPACEHVHSVEDILARVKSSIERRSNLSPYVFSAREKIARACGLTPKGKGISWE